MKQAPWWCQAVTRWGPRSPLGVVELVPVLALLVGWWNLRRDPRGRQIHDRPLDLIQMLAAHDRGRRAARARAVWRRLAY